MEQNPFYHRGPIRHPGYFFGREAETEQVASLVSVSQSVSIVGPRRIGKTSFLYHLLSEPVCSRSGLAGTGHVMASLSAEGLASATPSETYAVLLDALAEGRRSPLPPGTAQADYRALDAALKVVCAGGGKVTFVIDEFEALAGNPALDPSFFSGLRGLATRYPVAFVVASQRPLISLVFADHSVLSSPFFNIFATIQLGLFTRAQSRELVLSLLNLASAALPDPVLDAIAALAGPHPFFTQLAAYHALELARSPGVWDPGRLDLLAERLCEEAQPHLLYAWHNLPEDARYTLANLPSEQADPGARETLHLLEDQCLIRRSEGGYVYLSETVRRFVRCQEVPGLLQVDPFLIDVNRRLVTADGNSFALTRTQFDLLVYVAGRRGRVASNRELEENIWHDQYVDDPERIKAAIKHLRRVLGPYGACVVNQRGIGYALRPLQECRS
jgi:hypothetical protein